MSWYYCMHVRDRQRSFPRGAGCAARRAPELDPPAFSHVRERTPSAESFKVPTASLPPPRPAPPPPPAAPAPCARADGRGGGEGAERGLRGVAPSSACPGGCHIEQPEGKEPVSGGLGGRRRDANLQPVPHDGVAGHTAQHLGGAGAAVGGATAPTPPPPCTHTHTHAHAHTHTHFGPSLASSGDLGRYRAISGDLGRSLAISGDLGRSRVTSGDLGRSRVISRLRQVDLEPAEGGGEGEADADAAAEA